MPLKKQGESEMQKTYDRIEVGERLRERRIALELSREEVAAMIDRAEKYYADIERGSCGMSLETMIALSNVLCISVDNILYGKTFEEHMEDSLYSEENIAWLTMVSSLSETKRKSAMEILKKFIVFNENS